MLKKASDDTVKNQKYIEMSDEKVKNIEKTESNTDVKKLAHTISDLSKN